MRGQLVDVESHGLLSIKKSILLEGVDCDRVGRAVGRRRLRGSWGGSGGQHTVMSGMMSPSSSVLCPATIKVFAREPQGSNLPTGDSAS